jgi:hypothetical protein
MVSRFPSFSSSFSSVFILVVIVVVCIFVEICLIVEVEIQLFEFCSDFCIEKRIWNFNPAQDVIDEIFHDIAVRIERHGDTTSFTRKKMEI